MRIYLVRHCAALGQEPAALLSEEGRAQAVQLASFLGQRGVRRIVSSPFVRAVESARPLSSGLGVPIEIDDRLAERQLGTVEDGDWRLALKRSFSDLTVSLPDGESGVAAQERGVGVLLETFKKAQQPAALFSHGNLLTLIARHFDSSVGFEFWQALTNPDVFEVQRSGELFKFARIWSALS